MYRYGEEEVQAVSEVIRNGQWFRYGDPAAGHLQNAARFEKEWSQYFGAQYSLFVSSGTNALVCALAGLGLGPGDEVLVPGYTWIASATAPLTVGAIPIIVDIDESLTISPDAIEKAITPRTKAICPVHMLGLACDMDRIMQIARKHNLLVLEDACQCDGGLWREGRKLGMIGDMGAYSFNAYKVISCGEAGMVSTNNKDFFQGAVISQDPGIGFWPHEEFTVPLFGGLSARGNEILAAMMRVQLKRLPGIIDDLHRVHRAISERISGAPGVQAIPYNGSMGIGTQTGTGAHLGLRFENEERARTFAARFSEQQRSLSAVSAATLTSGAAAGLPIDSGRHVFCNWDTLVAKRFMHHDRLNPFNHPANAESKAQYGADALPRTLDILRSTAIIGMNPDWNEGQVDVVAQAIKAAAAQ